ncbi:protein qua-1-like [Macrobrachium rosenbergii]|uniref:protein qua-1-like n=1 Tax=Macrobrachium rosenbergii TaxID=79674 RepID=UPI0034D6B2C4
MTPSVRWLLLPLLGYTLLVPPFWSFIFSTDFTTEPTEVTSHFDYSKTGQTYRPNSLRDSKGSLSQDADKRQHSWSISDVDHVDVEPVKVYRPNWQSGHGPLPGMAHKDHPINKRNIYLGNWNPRRSRFQLGSRFQRSLHQEDGPSEKELGESLLPVWASHLRYKKERPPHESQWGSSGTFVDYIVLGDAGASSRETRSVKDAGKGEDGNGNDADGIKDENEDDDDESDSELSNDEAHDDGSGNEFDEDGYDDDDVDDGDDDNDDDDDDDDDDDEDYDDGDDADDDDGTEEISDAFNDDNTVGNELPDKDNVNVQNLMSNGLTENNYKLNNNAPHNIEGDDNDYNSNDDVDDHDNQENESNDDYNEYDDDDDDDDDEDYGNDNDEDKNDSNDDDDSLINEADNDDDDDDDDDDNDDDDDEEYDYDEDDEEEHSDVHQKEAGRETTTDAETKNTSTAGGPIFGGIPDPRPLPEGHRMQRSLLTSSETPATAASSREVLHRARRQAEGSAYYDYSGAYYSGDYSGSYPNTDYQYASGDYASGDYGSGVSGSGDAGSGTGQQQTGGSGGGDTSYQYESGDGSGVSSTATSGGGTVTTATKPTSVTITSKPAGITTPTPTKSTGASVTTKAPVSSASSSVTISSSTTTTTTAATSSGMPTASYPSINGGIVNVPITFPPGYTTLRPPTTVPSRPGGGGGSNVVGVNSGLPPGGIPAGITIKTGPNGEVYLEIPRGLKWRDIKNSIKNKAARKMWRQIFKSAKALQKQQKQRGNIPITVNAVQDPNAFQLPSDVSLLAVQNAIPSMNERELKNLRK